MSEIFDDDFEDLEDLLSSAVRRAKRIQRQVSVRRTQRSATEVSQDYAERLAEKAMFRRLLSDEALDGVRFRWLYTALDANPPQVGGARLCFGFRSGVRGFSSIESLRKFIDEQITKEETSSGPTA
jgi:hypothetical protein